MVEIKNKQQLNALRGERSVFAELCDNKDSDFVQDQLDRLAVGQKARIELPLRDLLANDLTAIYINPEYNEFEKIRAGFNRSRGIQFSLTELHRTRPSYSDYTTSSSRRGY